MKKTDLVLPFLKVSEEGRVADEAASLPQTLVVQPQRVPCLLQPSQYVPTLFGRGRERAGRSCGSAHSNTSYCGHTLASSESSWSSWSFFLLFSPCTHIICHEEVLHVPYTHTICHEEVLQCALHTQYVVKRYYMWLQTALAHTIQIMTEDSVAMPTHS